MTSAMHEVQTAIIPAVDVVGVLQSLDHIRPTAEDRCVLGHRVGDRRERLAVVPREVVAKVRCAALRAVLVRQRPLEPGRGEEGPEGLAGLGRVDHQSLAREIQLLVLGGVDPRRRCGRRACVAHVTVLHQVCVPCRGHQQCVSEMPSQRESLRWQLIWRLRRALVLLFDTNVCVPADVDRRSGGNFQNEALERPSPVARIRQRLRT
jgi:hypothetical protein